MCDVEAHTHTYIHTHIYTHCTISQHAKRHNHTDSSPDRLNCVAEPQKTNAGEGITERVRGEMVTV